MAFESAGMRMHRYGARVPVCLAPTGGFSARWLPDGPGGYVGAATAVRAMQDSQPPPARCASVALGAWAHTRVADPRLPLGAGHLAPGKPAVAFGSLPQWLPMPCAALGFPI